MDNHVPLHKGYEAFRELSEKGDILPGRAIRVRNYGKMFDDGYVVVAGGLIDFNNGKTYDPRDVLSLDNAPDGWEVGGWALCFMSEEELRESGFL